jgi:tetratricopeptide (TPR) repeat protein
MAAVPVVLLLLGQVKTARRQRRLLRTRTPWLTRLTWLACGLLGIFLVAFWLGLTQLYLDPWVSLTILVGGLIALWVPAVLSGRRRASLLNQKIIIAIQRGDYPKALSLAESNPAVVSRDSKLRYNYALVRIVLGRREEALSDLERLRRDDPGFKMTWLLLIDVYTDEGEYASALELAAQLRRDLPGHPAGPQAESWLLRRVGRLDEAETRARDVLRIDPKSAKAYLALAAVAFDRGDLAGAAERLARAERLTPGSVAAALLAAEIALATNAAGAEAAVLQAIKASKNNPLSFTHKAVAGLVQRLDARREAAPS